MKIKPEYFTPENSPGFIIHQLDTQMKVSLCRKFRANGLDFTAEQWGVVYMLSENEGIHQSELATITCKDRHNITRILNLLEKSGLIHRKPDEKDKRRLNVFLTNEGKALKQKIVPLVVDHLCQCFHGMTEEEFKEMIRIHRKVLKNIDSFDAGQEQRILPSI